MTPRDIVILQRRLTHYRVPFFEALKARLASSGHRLVLVHGQPTQAELAKDDEGELDWAIRVHNRYVTVKGNQLCWQPLPRRVGKGGLLVISQESSMLSNYPILAAPYRNFRLGFWGHGANFQSLNPDGLRERWKRMWLHRVDWWFAYTSLTCSILVDGGFPSDKITSLDNAIDTDSWRRELDSVTDEEVVALKRENRIQATAPVALYCGSLYREKRLDLMVEAFDRARVELPMLQLVVIGDGPEMGMMRDFAAARSWLHLTGALRGRKKATWYRVAQCVANPGLVGLGVLDAFVAGLPVLTTRDALHSPEIAYLEEGHNGLITEGNSQDYALAVVSLLSSSDLMKFMSARASLDSNRYTVNKMAERFASGAIRALASH